MPPTPSSSSAEHRNYDARSRKRDRDKENQRQKRAREKKYVERLEARNDALEQQLSACKFDADVQLAKLHKTIRILLGRMKVLDGISQDVRATFRSWEEEDRTSDYALGFLHQAPDQMTTSFVEGPSTQIGLHERTNVQAGQETFGIATSADQIQTLTDRSPHNSIADSPSLNGLPPAGDRHRGGNSSQLDQAAGSQWLYSHSPPAGSIDVNGQSVVSVSSFQGDIETSYLTGLQRLSEPTERERNAESPIISMAVSSLPPHASSLDSTSLWTSPDMTVPNIFTNLRTSPNELTSLLSQPQWRRLPIPNSAYPTLTQDRFGPIVERIRQHPEIFATCDSHPKALDLMFGGSLNELANYMSETLRDDPTLRGEKFGVAWLCYIYTMWRIDPSEDRYDAIPEFFQPTIMQLVVPHPPIFDCILWPQLRENFIRHGTKYCNDEVFGLLSCTLRIRGSFNGTYIVRTNGGEPRVDPEFLAKILSLTGWGVLEKFWDVYPELMEGMDRSKYMIQEQELIP